MKKMHDIGILTESLLNIIDKDSKSFSAIKDFLQTNRYSPYIQLYGGTNALLYNKEQSFTSKYDGMERFAINSELYFKLDKFKSFDNQIYSTKKTNLHDVVEIPELYKNYPEFKNIRLTIDISNDTESDYAYGSFSPVKNEITIHAANTLMATSTLIHELQHAIQIKEGFALGANTYDTDSDELMEMFIGALETQEGAFSDISTKAVMREINDKGSSLNYYKKQDFSSLPKVLENKLNSYINNEPIKENIYVLIDKYKNKEIDRLATKYNEKQDKGEDISDFWERRGKIVNKYNAIKPDGELHENPKLKDIFFHQELYEVYPELQDYKIKFINNSITHAGSFDSKNKIIELSLAESDSKIQEILLHEIQHAIQDIEGWAKGGSTHEISNFAQKLDPDNIQKSIQMQIDLKKIEVGRPLNEYERQHFRNEYERKINLYKKHILNSTNETSFDLYKSLWGEQQARATAYRINMSQADRIAEDWTKTLEKEEGVYNEPLIKYDSDIMEARILEEAFLNDDGKLNKKALKDIAPAMPKKIKGFKDFMSNFSDTNFIKTPVGDVKVNPTFTYSHLTQNTHAQNRFVMSGAFLDTLKDPLFVVKSKRDQGADNNVFYKAYKGSKGLWSLANFTISENGYLKQKTFFNLSDKKLLNMIKVNEEDLLYVNHPEVTKLLHNNGNTVRGENNNEFVTNKHSLSSKGILTDKIPDVNSHVKKILQILPAYMQKNEMDRYFQYRDINIKMDKKQKIISKEDLLNELNLEFIPCKKHQSGYGTSCGEREATELQNNYIENYINENNLLVDHNFINKDIQSY